jgi:hypothetical protein
MRALSEQDMLGANVNPKTGLATDYLNLFNEAIMLFEMALDMPDMAEELNFWHKRSYVEHFEQSGFEHKDVVIAAYGQCDPVTRRGFDNLCQEAMVYFDLSIELCMTSDLTNAHLRQDLCERLEQMKELVLEMDSYIHGHQGAHDQDAQSEVDALF